MGVGNRGGLVSFTLMLLLVESSLALLPSVAVTPTRYELLIIAHQDFLDPLKVLADRKMKNGVATDLVSWQDLDRQYEGWDAPERIKRGIASWHERYGVKYVLLVGDSDKFPVRYTMTDRVAADMRKVSGYGAYYACDLYYADLYRQDGSFDNWDYNGNHLYGELHGEYFTASHMNVDRIDMIPDLAVGRLPASSRDEVANYVEKVASYEASLSVAAGDRFKGALFVVTNAPDDDLDEIALDAKESIAKDLDKKISGFSTSLLVRLYDKAINATARRLSNGDPAEASIIPIIQEGVGAINVGGHGSEDSWGVNAFTTKSALTLRNKLLPIVFNTGCGTAQFAVQPPYEAYMDVNGVAHKGVNEGEPWPESHTLPPPATLQTDTHDSFPEHMLVNNAPYGAIAYVGCVTGSQAWARYLDEFFFKAYTEGARFGDMWKLMVSEYCSKVPTIGPIGRGETTRKSGGEWFPVAGYHQPMKFMFFGDPSLKIRLQQRSLAIVTTTASSAVTTSTSVSTTTAPSTTGTQPSVRNIPITSDPLLIIGISVIVAVIVAAIFLVKRKPSSHVTEATAPIPPQTIPSPLAATKYCINCGTSIPEIAKHCPKCGAAQQ
mgnify:FL=1